MSKENAATVFIGMGSNLGDSKAILQGSWLALGDIEGITLHRLSSPYLSAPVDMTSQHWFTNAVGKLEVSLSPLELLEAIFAVEASFGRTRDHQRFGYQDRSLDLDMLYYGDMVMDLPELTLPHPRISERLFVLEPLAEIAADFIDCLSGETIARRIQRLLGRMATGHSKKQEIIKSSWTE